MHEVGWMEGVNVEMKLYKNGTLQKKTVIEDTHTEKLDVDMTSADKLCLGFTKGSIKSEPFCKACEIYFLQYRTFIYIIHQHLYIPTYVPTKDNFYNSEFD